MNFREIVICDLDGCLSDDRWRRCLLPMPGASYDNYHVHGCSDCAVDNVLIDVLHDLRESNDADCPQKRHLLIVTSRPEKFKAQTDLWLQQVLPGIDYTLLMRPEMCGMHSPELKMHLIGKWLEVHVTPNLDEFEAADPWLCIAAAYDDRQDVLDAYPIGASKKRLCTLPQIVPAHGLLAKAEALRNRDAINAVPAILQNMATTFAERNKVYGSNYKNVAPIIKALWPQGVPSSLVTTDHWHLFELMVVKMTRFANSGLTHVDSVHDMAVYAAMIEAIISREENEEDADGQC